MKRRYFIDASIPMKGAGPMTAARLAAQIAAEKAGELPSITERIPDRRGARGMTARQMQLLNEQARKDGSK